jgi:hypothetical protein
LLGTEITEGTGTEETEGTGTEIAEGTDLHRATEQRRKATERECQEFCVWGIA